MPATKKKNKTPIVKASRTKLTIRIAVPEEEQADFFRELGRAIVNALPPSERAVVAQQLDAIAEERDALATAKAERKLAKAAKHERKRAKGA